MKSIPINLPGRTNHYEIKIGKEIAKESLSDLFASCSEKTAFIVTNDTIAKFYPDFSKDYLPENIDKRTLILPDGEQYKHLETIQLIYDFLAEHKANRKSYIIAFGGGVIGDMVGFAAATYMRGVDYIQVPTTLLSQVDSSVGGKTGVNHKAGKNYIGVFKQPIQTIIDINFLKTLPSREFIAGYGELIKHGLIKDPYLFQLLNRTTINAFREDNELIIDAIGRSCLVKSSVVESDEREMNQRAILNFGHTIGHFIETYTHYKKFLHGETIIAGMEFAAWWSFKNSHLEEKEFKIIQSHLKSLNVSVVIPKIEKQKFIEIIEHDKKASSDGIRFIGLLGIGKSFILEFLSAEQLWNSFLEYLQLEETIIRFS